MTNVNLKGPLYERFVSEKNYDAASKACIVETVEKMLTTPSDDDHPGMMLGKIQSGKTRTYLGVIALAFDNGYDVAIVLTKGTNALAKQTVSRLIREFKDLVDEDQINVADVMSVCQHGFNAFQLESKAVIVCKKEDDNLGHLLRLLFELNPALGQRRTLIVDDEADFGSVSYRKEKGEVKAGKLFQLIGELRDRLPTDSSFLQVTATPYSLYLQPHSETSVQDVVFKPTRPAFTVLVPIHDKYVGGDKYFRESEDPNSVARHLHKRIDPDEMDRLKTPDRRMFKPEEVLTDHKVSGLRSAILNFMVGACIRRMQQKGVSIGRAVAKKYTFVVHTDIGKGVHEWQKQILETLVDKLKETKDSNPQQVDALVRGAYEDLAKSFTAFAAEEPALALSIPPLEDVIAEIQRTLHHLAVSVVNSDNDVEALLDQESGQLRLTSPYTVFVGGYVLDRGLTIENMIGFFYGRSPKRFQQDTVLQHMRMYGARQKEDLPVTRFYTTDRTLEVMKNIHEFDSNLREQIEKYEKDAPVVFIQRDKDGTIRPCSPNKILMSETTNLKPFKRLLPVGFQTGYKTRIAGAMQELDALLVARESKQPFLMDIDIVEHLVDLIDETIMFSDKDYKKGGGQVPGPELFEDLGLSWDTSAFKAAMRYLSTICPDKNRVGKIWCLVRSDRDNERIHKGGRFTDNIDSYEETQIFSEFAKDIPMLMLFRQRGTREKGWMGTSFWWPVLRMPEQCRVSVFANEIAKDAEAED